MSRHFIDKSINTDGWRVFVAASSSKGRRLVTACFAPRESCDGLSFGKFICPTEPTLFLQTVWSSRLDAGKNQLEPAPKNVIPKFNFQDSTPISLAVPGGNSFIFISK